MRDVETSLRRETPPLRMGTRLLRMETPLRGRSGGHTGAAPTISRVAPCPKVAGKQFADGLNGSSQGVGGPIGLVGRGEQALASTFFILFLRINMIFYNFVLGF